MEEQLVSLEVAKLLKEKGFSGNSFYHYYYDIDDYKYTMQDNSIHLFISCEGGLDTTDHLLNQCQLDRNSDNTLHILAPTQSLAQKWLRETKGIIVIVDVDFTELSSYYCNIYDHSRLLSKQSINCNTYEEALEEGLKEALKLI